MDRYLRVGEHKVDNLSTMKTLQDIIDNNEIELKISGTEARATTPLKRIMRSVTRQLLDAHDRSKFHGDLKPENIIFLHDDFENPNIVGWKYSGSRNNDLKAVRKVLKHIFRSTADCNNEMDCELEHFLNMLRNNKRDLQYLRNHFWFHSAQDRCNFFTDNVSAVHGYLGVLPASGMSSVLNIPHGIDGNRELPQDSHLRRGCHAPTKKKVKAKNDNFQATMLFLSQCYSHEMEAGYTPEEIEAEIFQFYPTLMEEIYTTLMRLGVAHNFW